MLSFNFVIDCFVAFSNYIEEHIVALLYFDTMLITIEEWDYCIDIIYVINHFF